MKNRAPLIVAIVLLFLPVLYVGSYLALVDSAMVSFPTQDVWIVRYRLGGRLAELFYWPLEQIDRKVRPRVWQPQPEQPTPHRGTIGDDGLERIGIDFD